MFRRIVIAGMILTLGWGSALAENSLVVESKTVATGATATIGIFLSNDEPVRDICLPLVVREVTPGVYPTALSGSFPITGRLGIDYSSWPIGYLWELMNITMYDNEDGNCKEGQPGGFGTITVAGSGLTYNEHPNPSNPDGIAFGRGRAQFADLPAGSDGATPSMEIGVTAPLVAGTFEIDSTCRDPACHLLVLTSQGYALPMVFTKGTIDVIPCDCPYQGDYDRSGFCSSADCGLLIDILFAGAPDVQDPVCPAPRSDMDCDGFTTPMDLAYMIDYLWAGGSHPCDPCTEMTQPSPEKRAPVREAIGEEIPCFGI